jgi:hypothetical protein
MERTVLVVGRAEVAQAQTRLGTKALLQCRGDAGLAEAGFARDQHNMAVARLGACPAPQQQVDLLVAADQPAQRRSAQRLEPARDAARTQYLTGRNRRGDALHLDGAEIAVFEEIADQPARACGDYDSIRLGQGLQPRGEVRRFTDDRLFLRRSFADQIADDHQPGGDPDARLELDGFDIEAADSIGHAQPRPDRPLGIVLMGSRVAEIGENPVAHVFCNEAIKPGNYFSDRAVVGGDDLAQILWIDARREFGRADEVAEHHRQLPSLGSRRRRGLLNCSIGLAAQCGDRIKQLAAVAPEHHAEILEILRG